MKRLLIMVAALCAPLLLAAQAVESMYILVLKNGIKIECSELPKEEGRKVVFTDMKGQLGFVRADDVDNDATRLANEQHEMRQRKYIEAVKDKKGTQGRTVTESDIAGWGDDLGVDTLGDGSQPAPSSASTEGGDAGEAGEAKDDGRDLTHEDDVARFKRAKVLKERSALNTKVRHLEKGLNDLTKTNPSEAQVRREEIQEYKARIQELNAELEQIQKDLEAVRAEKKKERQAGG